MMERDCLEMGKSQKSFYVVAVVEREKNRKRIISTRCCGERRERVTSDKIFVEK